MELAALKKELHTSIDEVEDETILLKLKTVLEDEMGTEDLSYEDSPAFIEQINKAIRQIENGEVYSHEQAMEYIKKRTWRTR